MKIAHWGLLSGSLVLAGAFSHDAEADLLRAPRVTQGYGRTVTPEAPPTAPYLDKVLGRDRSKTEERDGEPLEEINITAAQLKPWSFDFALTPVFARDRESEAWNMVAGLSARKAPGAAGAATRSVGVEFSYGRPKPRTGTGHENQYGLTAAYGLNWNSGWALSWNVGHYLAQKASASESGAGSVLEYSFDAGSQVEMTLAASAGWARGKADDSDAVDDLRTGVAIAVARKDWSVSYEYTPRDDVSTAHDWAVRLSTPFGMTLGYGRGAAMAIGFSMDLGG